jgi:hypothetical protein
LLSNQLRLNKKMERTQTKRYFKRLG